jgi:hypothetical protein
MKPTKLEFEPKTHIYRLDGVVIPGFSEIAKAMGIVNYNNIPDFILEPTRNFGDVMHYTTKLWDLRDLDESTLDEPLKPCLEAYKYFLTTFHVEIIKEYIEQPICSFIYRYGITPDRIYLVNGELSVLELKFVSQLLPAVALQTAAQKRAAEEFYKIKIKHRYVLQITRQGDFKPPIEYKDKGDDNAWLCFLGAYNWLRRNNGKRDN